MHLLTLPPGLYRGSVTGPESGRCAARVEVRRIPGGLVLDYEATGAAGLQHVEHTVAVAGQLYVAHSEAPGVTVFTETAMPGTYDAPRGGPYDLRIVTGWDGRELTWAWHWAPVGQPPVEQSLAYVVAY